MFKFLFHVTADTVRARWQQLRKKFSRINLKFINHGINSLNDDQREIFDLLMFLGPHCEYRQPPLPGTLQDDDEDENDERFAAGAEEIANIIRDMQ